MKLIALDSSGLVASVAILEDDVLRAEYTANYRKTHSQTLLPMLDEIADMTGLDLKTVDAVAVSSGPGSFTGLRIGSATAKGLCLALQIPVVEVPTLAALAYNLYGADGWICPMMDARRQQVYNGIYHFENGEMLTDVSERPVGVAELAAELNERKPSRVIFLGDGVPVYRDMLTELLDQGIPRLFAPPSCSHQRAASVAALGKLYYERGLVIPGAEHAPVYLRKSQAEREREAKKAMET